MTLLAGWFARGSAGSLPVGAATTLRDAMSRGGDPVQIYQDDRAVLLKVDIGAFGEPAWHVGDDGTISMLAGEPLLALGDPRTRRSRTSDLRILHAGWAKGDWAPLTRARGIFCAVHYQPAPGVLTLITDRLGIRPLYYWADEHQVVFATALRILEAVAAVPKVMDLRGVTEALTLGTPLSDRTPYADVRLLHPGEMVRVSPAGIERRRYWRWDTIQPADRPEPEQVASVWERFSAAVACRAGGDTGTLAFLSGGLDSRVIVAVLRDRGLRVRTFNFAQPGTQEHGLAAAFAGAAGAQHAAFPANGDPDLSFSEYVAGAWREVRARTAVNVERPQLFWGGDGGSVALGGVYQSRRLLRLLRSGETDHAIDEFLRQGSLYPPRRILNPALREELADIPVRGMRDELEAVQCQDPGARLLLFLLFNEQRRELGTHFENIDVHRLEFHEPFFDSWLLEAVLEIPVDRCLYHDFYMKWVERLPPVVTAVPWQAYPGHAPCPLPIAPDLADQWAALETGASRSVRRRWLLRKAREVLRAPVFPHDLLRRPVVRLATWIFRAGWRDYGYLINQAAGYLEYWRRCGGRWRAPGPLSSASG